MHSTRVHPEVRGWKARIINGVAYAPSYAPMQVKRAIWAGDRIRTTSYCYGGGHGSWNSSCYDCSGSVSYVLHGAGLLNVTMDSTELEGWGRPGRGRWINVWGSGPHAFMEVAGIVFDTAWYSSVTPGGSGPRWQPASVVGSQLGDGNYYAERHPAGL